MTPPDSDAAIRHECQCGYRIVGRDAEGAHTWSKCRPDSGEREVRHAFTPRNGVVCLVCGLLRSEHDNPSVSLPLSLAQRILAALEAADGGMDMGCASLAAELRDLVTK